MQARACVLRRFSRALMMPSACPALPQFCIALPRSKLPVPARTRFEQPLASKTFTQFFCVLLRSRGVPKSFYSRTKIVPFENNLFLNYTQNVIILPKHKRRGVHQENAAPYRTKGRTWDNCKQEKPECKSYRASYERCFGALVHSLHGASAGGACRRYGFR